MNKKDLFPCPEDFAHDIESNDCVPCGDNDGSFTPYEEITNEIEDESRVQRQTTNDREMLYGSPEGPLDMFKKYGVKEIQKGKNTYKL